MDGNRRLQVDPSRTRHANQAVHLSDLLTLKFARERFGTEVPRYLRVTEPDGPSTDGGRKARQAILLCPQQEGLSSNLVCGFIDVVNHHAELRSFAIVKDQFERRHSRSVDISRGEYNRMLDLVQSFLDGQSYETRVMASVPKGTSSAHQPSGERGTGTIDSKAEGAGATPLLLSFSLGFLICYLLTRLGCLP